ncbi:MAG: GAP family protein [Acidimicrobiales bacterium]|nr:GAP family protein [Acidimicrobiales bacterium]
MADVWSALVPLILGSALVPIQIIVTILLLRSAAGKSTAIAWVTGMTAVRLVQGVVFGLILSSTDAEADGADSSSTIVSTLLLVVAVLFLVSAVRQLLAGDDPDAAPPKWLQATASMTPMKAFLLGAGILVIGAKFWVFTLGAIGAIGEADLGRPASILTYLAFVVLAVSVNLVLIGIAVVVPSRADLLLDRASEWLTRHNRVIMIVIGFVFGTWFTVKALDGLGVI